MHPWVLVENIYHHGVITKVNHENGFKIMREKRLHKRPTQITYTDYIQSKIYMDFSLATSQKKKKKQCNNVLKAQSGNKCLFSIRYAAKDSKLEVKYEYFNLKKEWVYYQTP